jgi:hypothetical protein
MSVEYHHLSGRIDGIWLEDCRSFSGGNEEEIQFQLLHHSLSDYILTSAFPQVLEKSTGQFMVRDHVVLLEIVDIIEVLSAAFSHFLGISKYTIF